MHCRRRASEDRQRGASTAEICTESLLTMGNPRYELEIDAAGCVDGLIERQRATLSPGLLQFLIAKGGADERESTLARFALSRPQPRRVDGGTERFRGGE